MIRYENISKSFSGRTILNGISLTVNTGNIAFVLGTSGTGKSVLLKTTVGLLKIDEGKIFVGEQEISQLPESELFAVRKKCGMVFQQPALFDSMSVFENIAFGLRRHMQIPEEEIKDRVGYALKLVRLPGVESKWPLELSYGMQKRVSLARTVALEPSFLLFDEPTTGLDPVTTTAINELIRDLSRELGTTSLVVSHDMKCAMDIADQIFVLDQGKVVESGSPQDLMNSQVPLVIDFLQEFEG